jgi:hypothetical protein
MTDLADPHHPHEPEQLPDNTSEPRRVKEDVSTACEHGSLARVCLICELTAECGALKAENAALVERNQRAKAELMADSPDHTVNNPECISCRVYAIVNHAIVPPKHDRPLSPCNCGEHMLESSGEYYDGVLMPRWGACLPQRSPAPQEASPAPCTHQAAYPTLLLVALKDAPEQEMVGFGDAAWMHCPTCHSTRLIEASATLQAKRVFNHG